jgi:hypothetical protein
VVRGKFLAEMMKLERRAKPILSTERPSEQNPNT